MTPSENSLCIFAVKRGELLERFDTKYVNYHRLAVETSVSSASFGELSLIEPCYGTSARAVDRTSNTQPKYIRITDFDDLGIELGHTFMTATSYSTKHTLQKNDILFARTGGTVGKTYFYDGTIGPAIFAGYCIRFRFDEDKVLPKFAYWCTKTESYNAWVQGIQRPSGQPNINKEEFKSYRINLPDLERQSNLIQVIEEGYTDYLAKRQQANELLQGINTFILEKMEITIPAYQPRLAGAVKFFDLRDGKTFSPDFYHPERTSILQVMQNAKNFCTFPLSELADFCRDSVSPAESGYPYLGLAGVESDSGELSGVSEEAAGQAFLYQKDDVLYGRLRPYLNKVLLAEENGICSTEFHVLRVKVPGLLPGYLATIMRSALIVSQTKHMMTGNTHPRISNDDIKKLRIPVPDTKTQETIMKELDHRRSEARILKQKAEVEWAAVKTEFERELLEG